jgi:UDP-3-O-[3-hydroxymyristoyl] glucosamine N-acyltransferase
MKLRDIAVLLYAELDGDGERDINRVAKIEEAGAGDITFIANPRYRKHFDTTAASAVIVGRDFSAGERPSRPALLRVADPYASFLKMLVTFHPLPEPMPPGIHPAAVIAGSASMGEGVRIGPHAVIAHGCVIGTGSMIGAGVVLGDGVRIGKDCLLYPRVTVREGCIIGDRVVLQPGAVIGSDGFGFAPRPDGSYEKIPQLGIVVIEDDVEIGANTTVDRATMGETRIRKGTKLDNLIQVAHNVVIGEHTVIAAQAGISGSTRIGNRVMIGGQVGFTGHLEIADRTKFGAQAGVHRSITEPGTTVFGSPALPQREAFRIQGAVTQLPDLLNTIRALQAKLEALEARLDGASPPAKGAGARSHP